MIELSTLGKNNTYYVSSLTVTEHPITINKRIEVSRFSILSAEQADQLKEIQPQLIALTKSRKKDDYLAELKNQDLQEVYVLKLEQLRFDPKTQPQKLPC